MPRLRNERIQSFSRGLSVIRVFGAAGRGLTLAEVAAAAGLTRASARRFLLTLIDEGYVVSDGRSFALRPRVLELGWAYLSTLGLEGVAVPHMERLVADIHESSSIAVLDGEDVVYVVRVPTSRIMSVNIAVGTRFPAYATSMGRVLLAALSLEERNAYLDQIELRALTHRTLTDRAALARALERVALRGYALVDQELEVGLRSVAVPIRDRRGLTVAALNASAHAGRTTIEELRQRILPRVIATAEAISADLAGIARPLGERRRHDGP